LTDRSWPTKPQDAGLSAKVTLDAQYSYTFSRNAGLTGTSNPQKYDTFQKTGKIVNRKKRSTILAITLLGCVWTAVQSPGQAPVPPPGPQFQPLSSAELDQFLGPIALYPDPLLAQILPAATLPSQVVLADRYVSGGGDPNLVDQQPWDASVQALARYPTVLKWMDDNLAWTTELGQAFLYQQQDVMDCIQRLRAQAQALGNLQSTPQESVINDNGMIDILPANPEVVYVPVYQPEIVYYQRPYGNPFISFGIGLSIGAWLDHDMDWRNHHVIEWDREHPRPTDWWSHRPGERPREEGNQARVWQPSNRPEITAANRGDRGWNRPEAKPAIPSRPASGPPQQRGTPGPRLEAQPPQQRATPAAPAHQPGPSLVQRPAQVSRGRPASGALIGVQSSHQTQQISSRGQQSRQSISRPAQPARPVASPRPTPAARSEAPSRAPSGPGKR
jgi:hypothetical protein